MKQKFISLLLVISPFAMFAQDFYGVVRKADSLSSPVYQANIQVKEGEDSLPPLKTYFDGGYKFKLDKNQSYTVRISYSGYMDTVFTITTDKSAQPSAQNVIVKLKKDGMRLMGVIRSRAENFPIKGATIILKNVMTREERRITTGVDGAYNFKLDYETNYRVSVDKRSPGIMNKYRDTTFYLSTIGFNQPLDYKLNITLDADLIGATVEIKGYDWTKQPSNKNVKPIVDVVKKTYKYTGTDPTASGRKPKKAKAAVDSTAIKTAPPVVAIPPKSKQKDEKTSPPVAKIPAKAKHKDEKISPPVVVIPAKPELKVDKTSPPVIEVPSKPKRAKAVADTTVIQTTPPVVVVPSKFLTQLKDELQNAKKELEELTKKEVELQKASAKESEQQAKEKQKKSKKDKGIEVVVIRDNAPPSYGKQLLEITRQKGEAEKKVKGLEDEIAKLKAGGQKK